MSYCSDLADKKKEYGPVSIAEHIIIKAADRGVPWSIFSRD